MTCEALVDHLQGRQAPPDDAVLAGEVVVPRLAGIERDIVLGLDHAVVHTVE